MGLDINANIEFINARSGRFEYFANLVCGRDYNFFGLITSNPKFHADGSHPLVAERGFPADASFSMREQFEQTGPEAVNPSWLFIDELIEVRGAVVSLASRTFLDATIAAMAALNLENSGESRFVFWFQ